MTRWLPWVLLQHKKNMFSCHSVKKEFPSVYRTKAHPSCISLSKQTLSNVIKGRRERSARWPLTRPDVIYTANAWQKLCSVSLTRCLLSLSVLSLPLSNAHSTPSHCTHTHTHTHTQTHTLIWQLPVPHPEGFLSCCGYLHHKQLQDTGGPLTGKCARHKDAVCN